MIRVEQTHLNVVAQTHPGMKGKNNEDRFAVSAFRLSERSRVPVLLAVLSDGIGGHQAGEVAAELAVNTISHHISESTMSQPLRTIKEAIHLASEAIRNHALGAPERSGMGATCSIVLVIGERLFTSTVGDSRIYLMRAGTGIQKLSTDHTWIQEALELGVLQPDQVKGHPHAHVIRRYLGSPTLPEADFRLRMNVRESDSQAQANQGILLKPADKLMLCSDGLTDLVEDPEILAQFQANSMEVAAQNLIDLANARGGHDNITIVAIQVPGKAAAVVAASTVAVAVAPAAAKAPAKIRRSWLFGCLGALLLVAISAAALFSWMAATGKNTNLPGIFGKATLTPTVLIATDTIEPTVAPDTDTPVPSQTPTLTLTRTATEKPHTITPWPTNTLTETPVGTITITVTVTPTQ
jgi:serine/threonine protein phosphatase PrpC